jgi:hypothetical protein
VFAGIVFLGGLAAHTGSRTLFRVYWLALGPLLILVGGVVLFFAFSGEVDPFGPIAIGLVILGSGIATLYAAATGKWGTGNRG